MFQQRGYVKVRIGGDMEALLDQAMNACSIDFAEWNEESGQRGVEVSKASSSSLTFFVDCDTFITVGLSSRRPRQAHESDRRFRVDVLAL